MLFIASIAVESERGHAAAAAHVAGTRAPAAPLVDRWVLRVGALTAVAFGATAALLASTLPYHLWDSMFYGTWSRLLGQSWGNFHADGIGASHLHRPLFYVLQGALWNIFGFHEWLGRLLSLLFTVILFVAVARLASAAPRRALQVGVALLVVVAVQAVELYAVAGLTDIPAAAFVAAAGAVLWTMRAGGRRDATLAVVACLAVLAKPSGLLGLLGLGAAALIGSRAGVRTRARGSLAPLAAGVVVALVYDWTQAHQQHMSLPSFLHSGVGAGFWAARSAAARRPDLLGWTWLGPLLHLLLVFAVAYALLRIVRVSHSRAALAAAPATWIWSWAGPAIGASSSSPPTGGLSGVGTFALAVSLPLFALAPDELVPKRNELERLLVWAVPGFLLWIVWAAYDPRLLSAAWPALALLLGRVGAGIVGGAARVVEPLALLPAAALVALALAGFVSLDGLGHDGWRQYRSGGVSGVADASLMRNVAYGQFEGELDALRREVRPGERIMGSDDRLGFFFPGQTRGSSNYPSSCAAVKDARAFVLLMSDESQTIGGQYEGAPTTVRFWQSCTKPQLTEVAEAPGNYAVFVVGKPRVVPAADACGVQPAQQHLFVLFGRSRDEAGADTLLAKVQGFGFKQADVERVGCNSYRVVETDIPTAKVGRALVHEAKTIGLKPQLVGS